MQSRVRFNRVAVTVWEAFYGEGLGGFGAEPDQVQQDLRPFNSPKPR